jgi:hypothetical protein
MTNISLYKINKYRSKLQSVHYDHPRYQLYLDKYIYYIEGGGGSDGQDDDDEPAPVAKKTSLSGLYNKGKKSVVKGVTTTAEVATTTAAKVATTAAKGAATVSKAYEAKKNKLKSAYANKKENLKKAIQKLNPGPDIHAAVKSMYDTAKTESLAILSGINLDPTENNILKIDLNKDIWKTVATKLITTKIQNNETVKKLKGEYEQALNNIEKIKKIPAQIASHGDTINAAMMSANILLSSITDITNPANIASLEKELNKIIAINNPSFATEPAPKSGRKTGPSAAPINVVKTTQGAALGLLNSDFAKNLGNTNTDVNTLRQAGKSLAKINNPLQQLETFSKNPLQAAINNPKATYNLSRVARIGMK